MSVVIMVFLSAILVIKRSYITLPVVDTDRKSRRTLQLIILHLKLPLHWHFCDTDRK